VLSEEHQYDRVAELAMLEQQERDLEKSAWRIAFGTMAGMAAFAITMIILALLVSGFA
jgi:hypothetical protein